jgi:heme-degrading monooxygenase HmoA
MTIVTVFRSRLRENVEAAYELVAQEMADLVCAVEGFIDQKSYVSSDGERVTIVRFADAESQSTWARHPQHLEARRRGREDFYSWYDISVSDESYENKFSARLDSV